MSLMVGGEDDTYLLTLL